jgi:hypothetical protein
MTFYDPAWSDSPVRIEQQVSDRDPQPVYCPVCGGLADFLGVYEDDESGHDLATYRCQPNGHEWSKPSRLELIRSIGWGSLWRLRRDQIQGG